MSEKSQIRALGGGAFEAECLIEGPAATGRGLALGAPISFWGGVDPKTGIIADVRHPQHGVAIAGTVLMMPGTIGSSSASAVLLELVHRNIAPAAIVMHEPDAILLLGVLVAREMGWPHPAAWRLDRAHFAALDGAMLEIG
jgi:predicted aconitase with swiveling domain